MYINFQQNCASRSVQTIFSIDDLRISCINLQLAIQILKIRFFQT